MYTHHNHLITREKETVTHQKLLPSVSIECGRNQSKFRHFCIPINKNLMNMQASIKSSEKQIHPLLFSVLLNFLWAIAYTYTNDVIKNFVFQLKTCLDYE